jgi:hypothetical protein
MACYAALRRDANSFLFCNNSPTFGYDSFGLLTKQDCEDAYDAAVKAANAVGTGCMHQAINEGLYGAVTWGIIGIVGGALGGLAITEGPAGVLPGAGAGFALGEVANLLIDMYHYHQCMKKVDQMKQAAKTAENACFTKVNQ